MRAVEYAFREAAASLWRSRGSSAFAVGAIALAMTVLGALLLITTNVERFLAEWSSAAEFSIYLSDDATSEQRGAIERMVDDSGISARRQYVSKTEALSRFRRDFKELGALAEGLEGNPFPASVEVQIRSDASGTNRVDALVAELGALAGVADVRHDREWMSRATEGLGTLRRLGFALALAMILAAATTVATVVRLALNVRRDEVELMQLVGSPYSFIRGPFVVEGLLQGGLGAILALLLLWPGFAIALTWWGSGVSAVVDPASLRFLPVRTCLGLVLGGMAVGSAGGFAAVRSVP